MMENKIPHSVGAKKCKHLHIRTADYPEKKKENKLRCAIW